MLKNYFVVAWRNLIRSRIFSVINILGLAIGLSVCALIYHYVRFEKSYDRFHANADRIFRVALANNTPTGMDATAVNHPAVGPALEKDFPEVEASTRFVRTTLFVNSMTLSYDEPGGEPLTFNEEKMYLADASFLTIFSFPLLEGVAESALKEGRSVVITERTRKKYFGDSPALGKQLNLNRELGLTVTGVLKDIPENSHLQFDVLVSFATLGENWGNDVWRWPEFYNYILLKPGTDAKALESKLPAFVTKYLSDVMQEYKWKISMYLQPVTSIHLSSHLKLEQDVNGSERTVYFLSLLGGFVLFIAWINYINLSTAKSLERSKEVGLRKVVGASKRQLVVQFFFDALLVNTIAMVLSLLLLFLTMPYFETIVGKDITSVLYQGGLGGYYNVLIGAALVLIAGTLLVGAYPALLLSSFNPAQVLKGKFYKSSSGIVLRRILVSFQYVVSIVLISGTITIYRQLSYMQHQDLGYSKDQILVLKSPAVFDSTITNKIDYFKNQVSMLPGVGPLSSSSGIPGQVMGDRNGMRKVNQHQEDNILTFQQTIDDNFLKTFDVPLAAGRSLTNTDRFMFEDKDNQNLPVQILINEEACHKLGFANPEDALHEKVLFAMGPKDHLAEIAGVVKNYHQVSLKEGYDPIMYFYPSYEFWRYFAVKARTENLGQTLPALKKIYADAFPHNAFEYFFLDEFFDKQYQGDVQFGTIFGTFTVLAIVIACLGLFGLSVFAVTQRTKEVGIRKVLGASVSAILVLFSSDSVKLLMVSYVVAVPIIYFGGSNWLANFAFHIPIGWQVFVIPPLFLLLISAGTISFVCMKAAIANPTDSLRHE